MVLCQLLFCMNEIFLDIVLCLLLSGYHKMRLNIETGCLHGYLSESLCAILVQYMPFIINLGEPERAPH